MNGVVLPPSQVRIVGAAATRTISPDHHQGAGAFGVAVLRRDPGRRLQ
jgi:hypothetical protein